MDKPQLICLTATKNEDWIIRLFLEIMSHVADHIIILDQNSTDNTREICREFRKVILIENVSDVFNEPERQKILIDKARELFPGDRLLLTFDADDIPSANILYSKEWKDIVDNIKPGVAVNLQNVCLYNSPYEFRTNSKVIKGLSYIPYAMWDNNKLHTGEKIHTHRIPYDRNISPIKLTDVVSMHYQFADKNRALSKQRWYMCYERVTFKEESPFEIGRRYDWTIRQLHRWRPRKSPIEWTKGWEDLGINLNNYKKQEYFWWTWDVLRYFQIYGEGFFKDLPIWDYDWEKARKYGIEIGELGLPEKPIKDPRSFGKKISNYIYSNYFPAKNTKDIFPNWLYKLLKYIVG